MIVLKRLTFGVVLIKSVLVWWTQASVQVRAANAQARDGNGLGRGQFSSQTKVAIGSRGTNSSAGDWRH